MQADTRQYRYEHHEIVFILIHIVKQVSKENVINRMYLIDFRQH